MLHPALRHAPVLRVDVSRLLCFLHWLLFADACCQPLMLIFTLILRHFLRRLISRRHGYADDAVILQIADIFAVRAAL